MAGASAAASARQRRSKQISKKDSIEIDSTYNRSDERLHAISSLFGQSDNDIDGSLRSLTPNRRSLLSKTKSRRDVTKIPTPRDDNDQHNNSSFVSCAIEFFAIIFIRLSELHILFNVLSLIKKNLIWLNLSDYAMWKSIYILISL